MSRSLTAVTALVSRDHASSSIPSPGAFDEPPASGVIDPDIWPLPSFHRPPPSWTVGAQQIHARTAPGESESAKIPSGSVLSANSAKSMFARARSATIGSTAASRASVRPPVASCPRQARRATRPVRHVRACPVACPSAIGSRTVVALGVREGCLGLGDRRAAVLPVRGIDDQQRLAE